MFAHIPKASNTRLIMPRDTAKKGIYNNIFCVAIKIPLQSQPQRPLPNKTKKQAERGPIRVKAAQELQRREVAGKQPHEANDCG